MTDHGTRLREKEREYKGRQDGLLEVECWCQYSTDVRNGRTGWTPRRKKTI